MNVRIEPITEDDGLYCSTECPFLEITTMCNGVCKRDGKALSFYDRYIAHCSYWIVVKRNPLIRTNV